MVDILFIIGSVLLIVGMLITILTIVFVIRQLKDAETEDYLKNYYEELDADQHE